MMATTQPTIVNNSDGTISLKGATISYTIDPTRKFRVITSCNNSNQTFDSKSQNGTTVYKNSIVEVGVLITPLPSTLSTTMTYQVWRSADIFFSWDQSKLEFVEAVADPFLTDKTVVDTSKVAGTVVSPGLLKFHSQALPPPESRTPPQVPQYFQWNFGGFMWSGGNRHIGKLRFKVISDFYYPTQLPTDIVASPTQSSVDGGVIVGTNLIGDIQNNANKIQSGPSPNYKVSMTLVATTAQVNVGDMVPVKVMVKPDTLPQVMSSVSTIFGWDNTKLEFMGIDKTGAKPSMRSMIDASTYAGTVNESPIPKDGNAQHNWLCMLGDKKPIDKETLIVTLNFKAISSFTDTKVEIMNTNDPRLAGISFLDETGVLGSCVPGSFVTGTINGVTIKGSV